MASSSVITLEVDTYLEMKGNNDFQNHSKRNSGGIEALIILFLLCHY